MRATVIMKGKNTAQHWASFSASDTANTAPYSFKLEGLTQILRERRVAKIYFASGPRRV
jgi:hypothetical protein